MHVYQVVLFQGSHFRKGIYNSLHWNVVGGPNEVLDIMV